MVEIERLIEQLHADVDRKYRMWNSYFDSKFEGIKVWLDALREKELVRDLREGR